MELMFLLLPQQQQTECVTETYLLSAADNTSQYLSIFERLIQLSLRLQKS